MKAVLNLDYLAAACARQMVDHFELECESASRQSRDGPGDEETPRGRPDALVTKTLGVLQEQGVYACMLYLASRKEPNARRIEDALWELLDDSQLRQVCPTLSKTGAGDRLAFFLNVLAGAVDDVFLIRDLYEQTLIYARYGAKARAKASR
jgi:hypothetical protein